MDVPVPSEKLAFFQEQIGLKATEWERLGAHRELYIRHGPDYAAFLHRYFCTIPETRILLDHERQPGNLKQVWAQWFASLFQTRWDEHFLARLWRSGLRHVEVNLDQRYVNLAYILSRQYCHGLAEKAVAPAERHNVLTTVDKMLDLCLLVETHAYLNAAFHCDREVVRGIAHQVRNPITVIGGNIKRLQRTLDTASPTYRTYEAIIQESRRLERMVGDIAVYTDLFQETAQPAVTSLETALRRVLQRLRLGDRVADTRVELHLDPQFPTVFVDPRQLDVLFFHLLENCLEAVEPENPYVAVTSRPQGGAGRFLEIIFFNTGQLPHTDAMNQLFTPFYSSKPTGTGFGLSIARLAASKNLGEVVLEEVPGEGIRSIVTLPLAESAAA
jgi:signal transduction histidine kinase